MELQRYEMGDYCSGYVPNDDGEVCMSYDVQRLEESHKELLEALKLMASHWSLWGAQMDMKKIDFDVVSIAKKAITKAEGGKPFQSIYLGIDIDTTHK